MSRSEALDFARAKVEAFLRSRGIDPRNEPAKFDRTFAGAWAMIQVVRAKHDKDAPVETITIRPTDWTPRMGNWWMVWYKFEPLVARVDRVTLKGGVALDGRLPVRIFPFYVEALGPLELELDVVRGKEPTEVTAQEIRHLELECGYWFGVLDKLERRALDKMWRGLFLDERAPDRPVLEALD